eukprot:TRINITY_DN12340_c0_g1_i1.p1 TRINITY_DN12340_c0_g1~~TRINITY_DN12340_c0_g1_i1.p1  ORF type:complete len:379 (+),score=64.31 TRINITY_DN12340_c0_g1_i1:962-2098(+)
MRSSEMRETTKQPRIRTAETRVLQLIERVTLAMDDQEIMALVTLSISWRTLVSAVLILGCFVVSLISLDLIPHSLLHKNHNLDTLDVKRFQGVQTEETVVENPCFNSYAIGDRCMPYFTIGGFMKSGTTALFYFLKQHPQVVGKALHWDFDPSGEKDMSLKNWLKHLPNVYGRKKVTFDKSPVEVHEEMLKRMKEVIPHLKIIFIFRNPVKRLISNYWMAVQRREKEKLPVPNLKRYITNDFKDIKSKNRTLGNVSCYNEQENSYIDCFRGDDVRVTSIAKGLYMDRINLWLEYFPRENFFFIQSEDFMQPSKRGPIMKELAQFLNLPPFEYDVNMQHGLNVGKYPDIDPEIELFLKDFYRPQNERLENFLGKKLGWD